MVRQITIVWRVLYLISNCVDASKDVDLWHK